MRVAAISDRWFVARAGVALVLAQARYWTSVAAVVRRELRLWEDRAGKISDPTLQRLALEKLREESFNAEAGAMAATIAPVRHREQAVEAIVAIQVMYDYLDALTEQLTPGSIRNGRQCFKAYTDAVNVSAQPSEDYYAHLPGIKDGGYLTALAGTVREALLRLPAIDVIADVIRVTASRSAESQVRAHAAVGSGTAQLEAWASDEAMDSELQWREWLLGAMGGVVAVHALVVGAANASTTHEQARDIDSTYLSLCVLITGLDHLVDHEQDASTGEQSCLAFYETPEALAQQLTRSSSRVLRRLRSMPNGPHHAMLLAGVVAYYTSQPSAMREFARPVTEQARDQLRPLITPTLAVMYAWRLAKRGRLRWRRGDAYAGKAHDPQG